MKVEAKGRAVVRAALTSSVLLTLTVPAAATDKITWKPVPLAVLKMDERPVKTWEIYRAAKKDHLILVQLGRRFLLLDTQAREVWELDPAALQRKGKDLVWEKTNTEDTEAPFDSAQGKQRTQRKTKDKSNTEAQRTRRNAEEEKSSAETQRARRDAEELLPSEDWVMRDAGRARIIRVRLAAEGRVLEVQLPQQPDLRSLY